MKLSTIIIVIFVLLGIGCIIGGIMTYQEYSSKNEQFQYNIQIFYSANNQNAINSAPASGSITSNVGIIMGYPYILQKLLFLGVLELLTGISLILVAILVAIKSKPDQIGIME